MANQNYAHVEPPFSPLWLVFWSFILAVGWLLPNHYAPWVAFHFDAWIAAGLTVAAVVVASRSRPQFTVHRITLFSAFAVCIPVVQFWAGQLPFSGQAWIGAAYLFGFTAAMALGACWETASPGQAVDALFLAIGIASVVSVGLALYQWLDLYVGALDLWIMGTPSARAFANFIQPNQLGTFLLWGLLACAWGVARGQIGTRVAILFAVYLLLGVALTQSRTASFAIAGLVLSIYGWRRLVQNRKIFWISCGLMVFYFVCVLALPLLGRAMSVSADPGMVGRTSQEIRLPAYWVLLDAAMQSPVFGYGWGQTAVAQLAVAQNHPSLGGIFMHAHNLFLDLVLWCGIPMGLLLSALLLWWFVQKIRMVANAPDAILVLFVGVVAWHAMLELPLYYAYMLLPTGLVMGVLNGRLHEPVVANFNRWSFAAMVLVAAALLGMITRDYLRIEANFYVLRFERARIGGKPTEPPLDVLTLNHMNEFVRLGRTPARKNMTDDELAWMHKAAHAFPALGNLFTLATALALNGRTADAQALVYKIRGVSSAVQYSQMQTIWRNQVRGDAILSSVSWSD